MTDDDLEIANLRTDTVSIDVEHYQEMAENIELNGATLNDDLREFIEEWREDADERLHPGESAQINEIMDALGDLIDDE